MGDVAAAYASQEGVAVLPAPAMMQNWWTALCPSGAMPDMKIQAALPRTGRRDWPLAVAVATAQLQPSGDDETLIAIAKSAPKSVLDHARAEHGAQLRAETKTQILLSLPNYYDHSPIDQGTIIGCLPRPLG